jgi:hypothetical protein
VKQNDRLKLANDGLRSQIKELMTELDLRSYEKQQLELNRAEQRRGLTNPLIVYINHPFYH